MNDFLQRWARRKQEAKAKPVSAPAVVKQIAPDNGAPEPEFDITTLPPVESITAISDVTAFLRAGVPAELTRAALRRVWTADPAIRDFVGLAENAWDFTDPHAMPGFGPLESTDEIRRMIAQVVEQIGRAAQPADPEAAPGDSEVAESSNDSNVIDATARDALAPSGAPDRDQAGANAAQISGNEVLLQSNTDDIAMRHDPTEAQEKPKQFAQRGHGGALPR